MEYLLKKPILSLLLLVLCCAASVWLFIYDFKIYFLDLTKVDSANIASTINGLTTPVLSFVTIVLIYITYKSQLHSESRQINKDRIDLIMTSISHLNLEINSVFYEHDGKKYTSNEAWVKLFTDLKEKKESDGEEQTYEYFEDTTHYERLMFIFYSFYLLRGQALNLEQNQSRIDVENLIIGIFKSKLKFLSAFAGTFINIDNEEIKSIKKLINEYGSK